MADEIVINELLFYIKNKLHSTPKDAVVDACVKFYSSDEILKGVEVLENSLNIRMTKRAVTTKSVTDIYDKLFSADSASNVIPNFVAADLSRVPRAREDSDSLATTEQLLASIHDLKNRVIRLESSHLSRDFFVESMKGAGDASSPPCDPPPPPLAPTWSSTTSALTPSAPSFSQVTQSPPSPIPAKDNASSAASQSVPHPASSRPSTPLASLPVPEATVGDGERWEKQQQNRRPRRNTANSSAHTGQKRGGNGPIVIGKKVNEGVVSWKGADLTVARYVGHVALGTTPDDISLSLQNKGVEVVELLPLTTKHSRFLSFKLVVKKSQLAIIEDENFWPEGVSIGRFWSPKASSTLAQTDKQ